MKYADMRTYPAMRPNPGWFPVVEPMKWTFDRRDRGPTFDHTFFVSCRDRNSPVISRKLFESNFLDLFLDLESRSNFLNFLNAEDPSEMSTIPRGLRVSLQGADGPVSLDLFHTRIPSQDSAGD